MSKLEDLAERVERLVLRHEELKRTNTLLLMGRDVQQTAETVGEYKPTDEPERP